MKYKIAIYCPDQHISYNLRILDEVGVGGGITSRVRMAHALASCGHDVNLYVNCPKEEILEGVQYFHYSQLEHLNVDIFIVSTSGDGLDLTALQEKDIAAKLRILLVHGIYPPKGLENLSFDYFYSPSNFVYRLIVNNWGIKKSKVFTTHRGVLKKNFNHINALIPKRDHYSIVYSGHPQKGLSAAIKVLRILRKTNSNFSLHVYGSHQLWGDEEQPLKEETGVFYYGLVGQQELAQKMQKHGFCINLQAIEDTFGIVNIEAMISGCIVVASNVGAYSEIIENEQNGFLLEGDHTNEETQLAAAELILDLATKPDRCKSIRDNAMNYPLEWRTVAETWTQHWDSFFGETQLRKKFLSEKKCVSCNAELVLLADGFHCFQCGIYQRKGVDNILGKSKKILIAGYYGFQNTGDEAILSAMIHDLKEQLGDVDFYVVSGDPSHTKKTHGVHAISWTDIRSITNAITACDMVILGGGGIFHDYWGFDPTTMLTQNHSGIAYFSGIALLAKLLKKPFMLYAIGIGPLMTDLGRQYTQFACEQAQIITVRDIESKLLLEKLGVLSDDIHLTADPAFGIQSMLKGNRSILADNKKNNGPVLSVAVRNWDFNISQRYWESQVAGALDIFIESHNGTVIFIPFQNLKQSNLCDEEVSERIRLKMHNKEHAIVLSDNKTAHEKANIISQSDLVLGMRFHSIVFAIASGIPAVGLVYDKKVQNLMNRASLSEYAIPLEKITAQSLSDQLSSVFKNRKRLRENIATQGDSLKKLAKENASLAIILTEKTLPEIKTKKQVTPELLKDILLSHTFLIHDLYSRLVSQIEKRDDVIQELTLEQDAQAQKHKEHIGYLENKFNIEISERSDRIALLELELLEQGVLHHKRYSEYETQLDNRNTIINANEKEIYRQESEIKKLNFALFDIQTSRYWKALSIYWRVINNFSTKYDHLRIWLRRMIPYSFRQTLVRILRKLKTYPLNQEGLPTPQLEEIKKMREPSANPSYQEKSSHLNDIICFSIIEWQFRFQRPQQLVSQFAEEGHSCFYVKTTFHQNEVSLKQNRISESIINIQLPGPTGLNIYTDELTPEIIEKMIAAMELLYHRENLSMPICLVHLPFWTPLVLELKKRWGCKIIYDCMDEHAGFSTNSDAMLHQEEVLLRNADLVLATSQILYQKCSEITKQVMLLPNAVDFEHFNHSGTENPISDFRNPIIGYIGAISDWFDSQMVAFAASSHPEWQFVLIGDTYGADLVPFQGLKNVHLLGEKAYANIPPYLSAFDVACIPFKRTSLTLATNPVKFYEYLSAGKPIVSVDLPELEPFKEYYYPVRSASEFVSQIEVALNEQSPEIAERRVQLAHKNTWNHRYQKLKTAVRQLYEEAIIIIANYNSLEYLDLCLNSIFKKTSYPNYRVIVVDNGSDNDVGEYLLKLEEKEPRLQAVFYKEMLGFARANNIGITAAGDCTFLVLLSNDTVVTKGWLTTLIKYLDDPTVTLVGPVTNAIGNEARIDVEYKNIDDMEPFAQQYCREHAGSHFDIPVLAMYCLAMRKSVQTKIGLLDERFGLGMFEDDDYTVRARQLGGRIICAEDVFVHHWGGSFFNQMDSLEFDQLFDENRKKFEEKWGQKWIPHNYRER
ncbi:MAG: glycosyltransferase [Anaerolineae bacterium]|nr:glycosyltransferase [Anaerolineae bacterium]MBT7989504.1 glycosyltransferase [Anaerolineae bacterium]